MVIMCVVTVAFFAILGFGLYGSCSQEVNGGRAGEYA